MFFFFFFIVKEIMAVLDNATYFIRKIKFCQYMDFMYIINRNEKVFSKAIDVVFIQIGF